MNYYIVKRSENHPILGKISGFLTADSEYGTPKEAHHFSSLEEAEKAISLAQYPSENSFEYEILNEHDD